MIFLMTGSWLGLRSRSPQQTFNRSPAETSTNRLDFSPSPFNLFERDPSHHFAVNFGEFVKRVFHPARYFPGEPVISLVVRNNISEHLARFIDSPFHPIKACAALFYVHMAVAFPRRMVWLIYDIGTQVAWDRVANASHYSDDAGLSSETGIEGGEPLFARHFHEPVGAQVWGDVAVFAPACSGAVYFPMVETFFVPSVGEGAFPV